MLGPRIRAEPPNEMIGVEIQVGDASGRFQDGVEMRSSGPQTP